jgi:lipopolysaccharide export LptBFGC system permease protein LptF
VKVLDRLVLRRFVGAYGAFSTIVLVVFVFADLFTHLDRFLGAKGGGFLQSAFDYYRAILPETWYMFAPFVSLVAGMWVVASLHRSNELIPLMAAGVRPLRVVAGILGTTALLAVLMWADRELLIPRLAELRRQFSKNVGRGFVIPNPVPDPRNGVLSGRMYSYPDHHLIEARYTRLDDRGREELTLLAGSALPEEGGWRLRDGVRVKRAPDGRDTIARIDSATGWLLETDIKWRDLECAIEDLQFVSADDLRSQIDRMPGMRSLEVQLAKRLAYPAASLVLLLLGLPFVLKPGKGGPTLGLLLCMGLCALFFVTTSLFEDMGSRPGGLDPVVAAWVSNIVFGIAGVIGFIRARV